VDETAFIGLAKPGGGSKWSLGLHGSAPRLRRRAQSSHEIHGGGSTIFRGGRAE
jgi:hypothetical protein